MFLRILMTSIGLLILMIWMLAKSLLQQCLPRNQRLHRYGFVVSENIRKLFGSKTIFLSYKGNDETHPNKLLAYTVNVTIPRKYMICLFTISMSIAPFEGNKVLALIHDISDRICRSRELIETKRWQKTPIS